MPKSLATAQPQDPGWQILRACLSTQIEMYQYMQIDWRYITQELQAKYNFNPNHFDS